MRLSQTDQHDRQAWWFAIVIVLCFVLAGVVG